MADFVFVDEKTLKKKKRIRLIIIFAVLLILGGIGFKAATVLTAPQKNTEDLTETEYEYTYESETEAVTEPVTEESVEAVTEKAGETHTVTHTAPVTSRPSTTQPTRTDTTVAATATTVRAADNASYSYVLNTNTMRIHYPYCDSVTEMNPRNRKYTDKSVAELKAEGYVPCGNCRPE